MFLFDGQVGVVADPGDAVAGGAGEGEQVLRLGGVGRAEVEQPAQRRDRRRIERPGVAEDAQAAVGVGQRGRQGRRGGARVAVEPEVVAVDAVGDDQHGGRRRIGSQARRAGAGDGEEAFALVVEQRPVRAQAADVLPPFDPEGQRMMPAPGLAGDGGGDEQQAQQQHRQAQAVALRLRPRVPAPQAQAEAQGDDAGQRLGRHPRQRPRLGARVFERFAGVGVGDGGEHQGAVRRRVVEFEQVGAGGAVGDEEQGVGAGGQRLQASPPR